MGALQSIFGSSRDPSLLRMRQLYLTKTRPLITYGCAVWFLRVSDVYGRLVDESDVRGKLIEDLVRELKSTEYRCVIKIAGAFKRTAGQYLLKELNIEPPEDHLERCSSAFRARALGSTPVKDPSQADDIRLDRPAAARRKGTQPDHPYYVLEGNALHLYNTAQTRFFEQQRERGIKESISRKAWQDSKVRAKNINACAQVFAEQQASAKWDTWRFNRRHDQPVLWDEWGKHNLILYRGLTRAQSTILFQCRTGVGGFGTHLFKCKVISVIKRPVNRQTNEFAS